MRLTLEIAGRVLNIALDKAEAEREPEPQGSQCGVLETAADPGEDVRMSIGTMMPLGFGRNG